MAHVTRPDHCICGGAGVFVIRCTPRDKATGQQKCGWHGTAHACICELQLRAGEHRDAVRQASGLNLNQEARLTVESFNHRRSAMAGVMKSSMVQFIRGTAVPWLVLIGPTGSGKTHVAAAITRAMVSQNVPARFVNADDLLEDLREGDRIDGDSADLRLRPYVDVNVLAVDDVRIEMATTTSQISRIERLLTKRFENLAPTVVTSNQRLSEFPPRLQSRFQDPTICDLVITASDDQRTVAS
jgi:DNA replication protein DnaC